MLGIPWALGLAAWLTTRQAPEWEQASTMETQQLAVMVQVVGEQFYSRDGSEA